MVKVKRAKHTIDCEVDGLVVVFALWRKHAYRGKKTVKPVSLAVVACCHRRTRTNKLAAGEASIHEQRRRNKSSKRKTPTPPIAPATKACMHARMASPAFSHCLHTLGNAMLTTPGSYWLDVDGGHLKCYLRLVKLPAGGYLVGAIQGWSSLSLSRRL